MQVFRNIYIKYFKFLIKVVGIKIKIYFYYFMNIINIVNNSKNPIFNTIRNI